MTINIEKRIQKILSLRGKQLGLLEIGENIGVSRERIRQIVQTKMTDEQRKIFYSFKTKQKDRTVRVTRCCPICGTKDKVVPSCKQQTCSRKCGAKLMQKHKFKQAPDGLVGQARIKWLYQNDKNFRKLHAERMHTRWERLKANKKKYIAWSEKQAIYTKRWVEKHYKGKVVTKLPK